MLVFLLRRLCSGVSLLLAISLLAFLLLNITGSNAAQTLLGESATAEQVAQKASELGLDRHPIMRYLEWLAAAIQGDLGTSWFTSQPIQGALATRLPVTLSIVVGVLLVSAVCAFALGVAAGVYRGWLDRAIQVFSIVGFALPGFLIALFLVFIFGIQLKIVPAVGYIPFGVSPVGWLSTIALPIIALSIGAVAVTAQQVRNSVIETMNQDYVRTLRSRGLPERTVILTHVLRGSATTGITVLAVQFVAMLGGAVVIEQIFALPGIGSYAVEQTSRGDIPAVMGVVITTVVIVVIVNLIADLGIAWLNPKVRVS